VPCGTVQRATGVQPDTGERLWSRERVDLFIGQGGGSRRTSLPGRGACFCSHHILAASLPLGTLADRWSAARTVCGGGAFVLVATATTSLAAVGDAAAVSESGRGRAYALLVVAMALWGVVNATIDGPAQALYASSMRRADRTRLMTRAFQLYTMAAVAGRGLSAAVFWAHGDAWSLPALRDAILVGVGCEVLAGGAMCCYRRPACRSSGPAEPPSGPPEPASRGGSAAVLQRGDMGAAGGPLARRAWLAAAVLVCSNVLQAWGAGMTVRFFPLYLARECRLSPVRVQAVYLALPVAISLSSSFGERLAASAGRVPTMAALKAAGCLLLVGMYFAADSSSPLADSRQPLAAAPSLAAEPSSAAAGASLAGSPSDPPPLRLSLTVALFLLRGGLANSTTPLSSALLMDSAAGSLGGRRRQLGQGFVGRPVRLPRRLPADGCVAGARHGAPAAARLPASRVRGCRGAGCWALGFGGPAAATRWQRVTLTAGNNTVKRCIGSARQQIPSRLTVVRGD